MLDYTLPKSAVINGETIAIRSDFRPILDICVALQDDELTDRDKAFVVLKIFYERFIPFSEEALNYAFWFINGGAGGEGDGQAQSQQKLLDWQQDFPLIISAVNKVAGCELRALDYVHWWTFLGYFQEIDDCLFARVVAYREKRARGKKMDDTDKDFYKRFKHLINFKTSDRLEPSDLLKRILGQGGD